MVVETLPYVSAIQDVGIGAVAFLLIYFLLRNYINRSAIQADMMMKRSYEQADAILDLARTTIQRNTEALEHMQDSLLRHMKQKDVLVEAIQDQTETFVAQMKDCKNGRDKKLAEILKKQ